MNSVRSRELRHLSEALEKIHQEGDLDALPVRIFEVAEDLLPGVLVTVDEFNFKTKVARNFCSRPGPEGWSDRLRELVPKEHPAYHALLAGAREPLRLSDLITDRELRRTGLHHDVFAPMGIFHQIALPLFIRDHVAGVTLNRDRPFTDAEVGLASLLAPHIALAHVQAQRITELRALQSQTLPDLGTLEALGLTPRETEVLHWIIQGKRDAEISQIIGCRPRTVTHHVQHILAKLGVETRTAAASEAIRRSRTDAV